MGGYGTRVAVVAVLVAGCSDSGSNSPLPQLADRGGPVMGHVQLVPIFYSDDTDADTLTQFSRWIVASSWLTAVGGEYRVGKGSVLGVVHRAEAAPDAITDDDIATLLFHGLADGTIPKPANGGLGEVLYMIHFPAHTVVTAGGDKSCVDFGGYHASTRAGGVELAYAVIATCPGFIQNAADIDVRELVSSHELIEAATDPFPSNHPAFQLRDPASPWLATGEEVADLCIRGDQTVLWRESGFVAQRSWSNAAAAAEKDPCVPGGADPYFSVLTGIRSLPRIAPGGHQPIQLTGWAPGAPDSLGWKLEADPSRPDEPTLTLGTTVMNTRTTTTLDVAVPSTAQVGTTIRWYVYSYIAGHASYQVQPMLAVVGDPCSSFTTCESCATHAGCGFCAATGKCEAEGGSGSAESSCPASSFARWAGSCPGFCGGHNASCTDCASQSGCGWCATGTPQCVEANRDTFAGPAKGTCAYADWSFTPNYCPL